MFRYSAYLDDTELLYKSTPQGQSLWGTFMYGGDFENVIMNIELCKEKLHKKCCRKCIFREDMTLLKKI